MSEQKTGKAFVLSGPAGTGKTTLVNRLTRENPMIVRNISYTTRSKRETEKEGIDYHFVSHQDFEQKVKNNDFIEYAEVFKHFYGTDKKSVHKLLEKGFDVVLVIDTQGALAIKSFFKAVYIFLGPPSISELEKRLKKRKTESELEIERRLLHAKKELEQVKHYDYKILNVDLDDTYEILKSIFVAEKHKV